MYCIDASVLTNSQLEHEEFHEYSKKEMSEMKKATIIAKGKVQKVGYRDFVQDKIKYGDVPEELGDRLGAALLYLGATNQKIDAGFKMLGEKQDQMLEKQDMMLQKQDDTIAEIKSVSGKMDRGKEDIVTEIRNVSVKIEDSKEDSITEIKGLREDLRSYMEHKFAKIEYEIAGIKAKIGMV